MGGMLLRLLPLLALVACSPDAPMPKASAAEKDQAAQEKLAATPQPRVYRYAEGEMRVFEVPVQLSRSITSTQTCFVWRDTEMRSVSMQCPADIPDPPLGRVESDSRH